LFMSKIVAIKNAQIVLENGIIWDGTMIIEDGVIKEVGSHRDITIPEAAEVVDAEGAYVGPGFIDLHCHGGDGLVATTYPVETYDYFLPHGTTSLLLTMDTRSPLEDYLAAFVNAKAAMGKRRGIRGVYMQGPFINVNYGSRAHLSPWKHGIPEAARKALIDGGGEMVKIWTIAPERDDIMEFATYARKVNPGCVFSVGHTEATPAQIRAMGTKYRPSLMTHFGDATGTIKKDSGGTRGYGPNEYCLSDHEMFAELISDSCGLHVHADNQKMLLRGKGYERVVLITDRTPHRHPKPEQFKHIIDVNFTPDGEISGSRLTMDLACRNIMAHTNCGIAQAFVMASLNPAKVLGLDDQIGSVEPGKIADLVFVDDKFNVQKVMLAGDVCKF